MTPALAAAAPAGHAADPIIVILLALGIAAGYAVSLYLWPLRTCLRCHGTRINPGSARRFRSCKRCHGTGRIRRIGATAVHRFYWSALGDQHRERRRAKLARHRQDAGPPNREPKEGHR
jgi:hypothetical protein